MAVQQMSLLLASPEETARVAASLARGLIPGDTLLLTGPVGAGKTHFARHLISTLLTEPEDIPSPTFTLVQTYETTAGDIWHADLYRIGSVQEIEELGLAEAFETAICVVEWPDRLGPLAPPDALSLELADGPDENSRQLTARWTDTRWTSRLARLEAA